MFLFRYSQCQIQFAVHCSTGWWVYTVVVGYTLLWKKCTRKLSVEDVNATELHFRNMDQSQRRHYVLAYLSDHSQVDYSGDYMTEFMVKGKSVCREVWLLIHSINKEWFRRLFNKFKEGAVKVEHGNKGTKKPQIVLLGYSSSFPVLDSTSQTIRLFICLHVSQDWAFIDGCVKRISLSILLLLDCRSSTQSFMTTFHMFPYQR